MELKTSRTDKAIEDQSRWPGDRWCDSTHPIMPVSDWHPATNMNQAFIVLKKLSR